VLEAHRNSSGANNEEPLLLDSDINDTAILFEAQSDNTLYGTLNYHINLQTVSSGITSGFQVRVH
jgi:hypothetical protein